MWVELQKEIWILLPVLWVFAFCVFEIVLMKAEFEELFWEMDSLCIKASNLLHCSFVNGKASAIEELETIGGRLKFISVGTKLS